MYSVSFYGRIVTWNFFSGLSEITSNLLIRIDTNSHGMTRNNFHTDVHNGWIKLGWGYPSHKICNSPLPNNKPLIYFFENIKFLRFLWLYKKIFSMKNLWLWIFIIFQYFFSFFAAKILLVVTIFSLKLNLHDVAKNFVREFSWRNELKL